MAILDPLLVAPKNYPPPYPVPPLTSCLLPHSASSSTSTLAIHSTLPAQFSSLFYYLLQLPIPLHQPVKPHTHVFEGFYFFHHPTQMFHLFFHSTTITLLFLSQLFFHSTTITLLFPSQLFFHSTTITLLFPSQLFFHSTTITLLFPSQLFFHSTTITLLFLSQLFFHSTTITLLFLSQLFFHSTTITLNLNLHISAHYIQHFQ